MKPSECVVGLKCFVFNVYLILSNVFDGKVEPNAETWVTGIRSNEEVILKLGYVINST